MVKKDIRHLPLADIQVDNALNPRQGALDQDAVLTYSQHISELPMMHVYWIDGKYYLTRGFHRFAAHQLAQVEKAYFEVHTGTMEEAREDADLDNLKHGIQLTRAERRAVVGRYMLRHSEQSDVVIARACYTTDKTVRVIREELEASSEIPRHDKLQDANGIWRPRIAPRPAKEEGADDGQIGLGATPARNLEVWELEGKVKSWLATVTSSTDEHQTVLQFMKDGMQAGIAYLDQLIDALKGQHYRGSDLRAAYCNVLEQMKQREAGNQPGPSHHYPLTTEERAAAQAEIDRQAAIETAREQHEAAGSATPLTDAFSDLADEIEPDPDEEQAINEELVEAGLAEEEGREAFEDEQFEDAPAPAMVEAVTPSPAPLPAPKPAAPAAPPPPPAPKLPPPPPPAIVAAALKITLTVQPTGATLISAMKGEESVGMQATHFSRAGEQVQKLTDQYYQEANPAPAAETPASEPEAEAEWLAEEAG